MTPRIVAVVGIAAILMTSLGACGGPNRQKWVGSPKDDAIRALGEPTGMFIVDFAAKTVSQIPIFIKQRAAERMPDNTAWAFEYWLSDSNDFWLICSQNRVKKVLDGRTFRRAIFFVDPSALEVGATGENPAEWAVAPEAAEKLQGKWADGEGALWTFEPDGLMCLRHESGALLSPGIYRLPAKDMVEIKLSVKASETSQFQIQELSHKSMKLCRVGQTKVISFARK